MGSILGSISREPRPSSSKSVFTGDSKDDHRAHRKQNMEDDNDSESHMSISSDSGEISESTPKGAPNSVSEDDYAQLPHHQANAQFAVAGTRLSELTPEDQELQARYFGIRHPNNIVNCVTCGEVGHTGNSCPALTCKHCGAFKHHTSSACPKYRKCRRCRQRGHEFNGRPPCVRPRVEPGKPGDPCDVCGELGHPEETCKGLWSTVKPDPKTIHKIDVATLKVSCYNCASDQHFGDDCPTLPDFLRGKRTVWNSEFASHFVEDTEEGGVSLSGFIAAPRANTTARSWQTGAFDDMRDY